MTVDADPTKLDAPPAPDAVHAPDSSSAPAASGDFGSPVTAVTRDVATVTVDGVDETWRLEWRRPPVPDCVAADEASTCVCAGFAYGERGELDLVRLHPDHLEDRLHLAPLFDDQDARLMRWDPATFVGPKPTKNAKPEKAAPPTLATMLAEPPVHILKVADYDHDGRATEFPLQLAAGPCGHSAIALVGISRKNPALHAFVTVEKPKETFTLDRAGDWEKLRASPTGHVAIPQIECGDHGSDVRTAEDVRADGELHSVVTTEQCAVF